MTKKSIADELSKKIEKLENTIKYQKKVIESKKIEEKININIYQNVFKILKKILSFNYNCSYSIYGTFLENLISNSILENTTIHIFLKNRNIDIQQTGLLEILYIDDDIENKTDYNELCYYSIKDYNDKIPYYQILLRGNIKLILHSGQYFISVNSSIQNIELTENGLQTIKNIGKPYEKQNIKGLNILSNLYQTMQKKIRIYREDEINNDLIKNTNDIFEYLVIQNEYIDRNYKIQNPYFQYKLDDCCICIEKKNVYQLNCTHSFCSPCLYSHLNTDSYQNKNCPLCRREMFLKIT
jgi:hypothetical protein